MNRDTLNALVRSTVDSALSPALIAQSGSRSALTAYQRGIWTGR
jgi:hypothetical protein